MDDDDDDQVDLSQVSRVFFFLPKAWKLQAGQGIVRVCLQRFIGVRSRSRGLAGECRTIEAECNAVVVERHT